MDAAMCDAAVRKVMSRSSELRARTPGAPTVLTYKQGYYGISTRYKKCMSTLANGTQIYET